MNKIISILKAFVVIALLPILLIAGTLSVAPIASICLEKLSHPLFSFVSIILMLPWGFLFFVIFFFGISFQPSFVVTSTGNGGVILSSGKGRGGGIILSIIKFVLTIPIALILWIIISIISIFSCSMRHRIDKLFEEFIEKAKDWYKIGFLLFVVFPIIVFGFNVLENQIYSPSKIKISINDFYYEGTHTEFNQVDFKYENIDYYILEYTIDCCNEDITSIKGEWEIKNKKTGQNIKLNSDALAPYDWRWEDADKTKPHHFDLIVKIKSNEGEYFNNINELSFICNINYISYNSNILILGDFLFKNIDNEYEEGYPIEVIYN